MVLLFETTGLDAIHLPRIWGYTKTITFVLFPTMIHLKAQELFPLQLVSPNIRSCPSLEYIPFPHIFLLLFLVSSFASFYFPPIHFLDSCQRPFSKMPIQPYHYPKVLSGDSANSCRQFSKVFCLQPWTFPILGLATDFLAPAQIYF